MLKVAILYGLAEGPALSKRLENMLEAAGHRIVQNASEADIIFTHSGGYIELPKDLEGKQVILTAPSCGRKSRSRAMAYIYKFRQEIHFAAKDKALGQWARRALWNTWYLLIQPHRLIRMLRADIRSQRLPVLNARRVVVICCRKDPWSDYLHSDEVNDHTGYCFVRVTGPHDDLWIHPEKYLAVVQS